MDIKKLQQLKMTIESLDKLHHIKILQIINNNKLKFSENRNGVFINMNLFTNKVVKEIEKIIEYINQQEKTINDIEKQKKDLNKDYFLNNNKEIPLQ